MLHKSRKLRHRPPPRTIAQGSILARDFARRVPILAAFFLPSETLFKTPHHENQPSTALELLEFPRSFPGGRIRRQNFPAPCSNLNRDSIRCSTTSLLLLALILFSKPAAAQNINMFAAPDKDWTRHPCHPPTHPVSDVPQWHIDASGRTIVCDGNGGHEWLRSTTRWAI